MQRFLVELKYFCLFFLEKIKKDFSLYEVGGCPFIAILGSVIKTVFIIFFDALV